MNLREATLPYVVQEVDYQALREMIGQIFQDEYGTEVIKEIQVNHFNPSVIDVAVGITARNPTMDSLAQNVSELLRNQGVRVAIRFVTKK